VGKTRLALAAAARLLEGEPDSVRLVELASLADPALVPGAVAQALGLREEPGRPILDTLTGALRGRRLLLVLDNCEHLAAACTALAGVLLRACPELRLLATSRAALGLSGERRYRVPPLSAPEPHRLPPLELVGSYEAVRLFVARAQERQDAFALTAHNAQCVAAICARLDGIPLAIELAAARVGVLPVEEILIRLEAGFRLLTGGPRDAPSRQRTLRATLDWSWALLGAGERSLLRRLAVFAGGCKLDAAEQVCGRIGIEECEALDLLERLVDQSLVQLDERAEEARYRLLETVRQYAAERLVEAGEERAVRERHLEWCVALAEEAQPQLRGPAQVKWLGRLETEHNNLRAALGWAREGGTGELGLRLAGALGRFWSMRGYFAEGRSWLEAALAGGGLASPVARATALYGAGVLATMQGDYGQAVALAEESLGLYRELADRLGLANSLSVLGQVAQRQGDYGRAAALLEESLALHQALGHTDGTANVVAILGGVAALMGDYGRATALYEESLALCQELGDTRGTANVVASLGRVAQQQGDYGRAAALLEEGLALYQELGDAPGIAWSLNSLGELAHLHGEYGWAMVLQEEALALHRTMGERYAIAGSLFYLALVAERQDNYRRATALLHEALLLGHEMGARHLVVDSLEVLAWVTVVSGQARSAARLGGAAEALREALGAPLSPDERAGHDQAVQAMRAALGEEAFAVAWTESRALSLDGAVALALERRGDATPELGAAEAM
jgi:non-specific serine/threonine protein kinase